MSVHRRKNSKYWWGAFIQGGVRKFRSTGQVDRRAAEDVVRVWRQAVQAGAERQEGAEQARRVLGEVLERAGRGRRVTVREFCERWVQEKRGVVSAASFANYGYAIGAFLTWAGAERADGPLDRLSRDWVLAFRDHEAAAGLHAKTVNHRVKVLRMAFEGAVREGWLPRNVAVDVPALRLPRTGETGASARRPFTEAELAQLLAVADAEWTGMIRLGLLTGMRLGDLGGLRWEQWGPDGLAVETRKTGAHLLLPLEPARCGLVRPPGGTGPLFPVAAADLAKAGGQSYRLSKTFGRLLREAGLPGGSLRGRQGDRGRTTQALCFHSLRHTARTQYETRGVPSAVIDAILGHDGRTGRKFYTHIGADALREVFSTPIK